MNDDDSFEIRGYCKLIKNPTRVGSSSGFVIDQKRMKLKFNKYYIIYVKEI